MLEGVEDVGRLVSGQSASAEQGEPKRGTWNVQGLEGLMADTRPCTSS